MLSALAHSEILNHHISSGVTHTCAFSVADLYLFVCSVLARYAPPEFCAIRQGGGVDYPFGASAEVWSLGCLLADMAGIPRAVQLENCDDDVRWIEHLTGLPGPYEVLVRRCNNCSHLLLHALTLLGGSVVAGIVRLSAVTCTSMHMS